jgi:hypothetical protein
MMINNNGYDTFDAIALFNTFLGLLNYDKNSAQHEEQNEMQVKLDAILLKVENLERMITDGAIQDKID